MRMSDWSSDVCSSDLLHAPELSAAQSPQTLMEKQRYEARLWAHGPKWQTHSIAGERWNGFDAVRALGDGDDEILLVPLAGHTRGHTGVAIRDNGGWRLHCGDAYLDRKSTRLNSSH